MKDLRRDMTAWSDDRLRDFESGFRHQDHNIARAYLEEVAQEWQRRMPVIDQKNQIRI
jgi:hypothetical protein